MAESSAFRYNAAVSAWIMAIPNQKGGVGKTTTVAGLGTEYARQGKRTLLVDPAASQPDAAPGGARRGMMSAQDETAVPKKVQPRYDEITSMTDVFCRECLDDEYLQLCRKLAAKLSRKRPSPLEAGRARTWAAAIVYTIGRVNFLFDKSQTPHMRADELCQGFGLGKSTVGSKSSQIMDLLHVGAMDPEWTRASKMDENPMAWMISVNGLIVDVRNMPLGIQVEAYRRGLIPYVPRSSTAPE